MSSQNNTHNPLLQDDDIYEDDDDEAQPPGPGAYFNPQLSTTFKVKPVPERL